MGFFIVPASIHHHGKYEGALFDHSYEVAKALVNFTEKLGLEWQSERGPYIVGMFHDLCKTDNYIKTCDEAWEYNNATLLPGHGDKSVMMLQQYIRRMPSIEPKSPDKNIIRLLKAIKINGKFDKAYSFNYTNLQNELIRFAEFETDSLPDVVNIHRTPSDENHFNIVLGINEDPSIPKCYRFLFKSSQTESTNLLQDMAKADEVIFYGLSFGEIDFIYFKSFFKHIASQSILDSKKHITIFTFGKNSVESIQDSLYAMGVLIQDLKENSYFSIIDMEKIWLPGYDEKAFSNTVTRLES